MEFSRLIEARWSPREYTSDAIERDLLREVFGAVRWAQSSYNEQPWRFLAARQDDQPLRGRLEGYLVEGNAFAKEAAVLGIAFAKRTFARNGKPNRVAVHDLGAATQMLALRAWDLGLNTRFMAGFDVGRAQEEAPEDFAPVAMFVIGRAPAGVLAAGPGDRGRRPVEEYVFGGAWGKAFRF
jgi:nitroreductase